MLMETLNQENVEHLLDPSLENLHRESLQWMSEVELWKHELVFFQKLLEQNAPGITSTHDKKELSHLQNVIIYYNGELLDEFKQKVRRHKKYLANKLLMNEDMEEGEYRKKHGAILSHLSSFRSEFNMHKKEFFQFLSQVMEKDRH